MKNLLTAAQCREIIAELAEVIPKALSSGTDRASPFDFEGLPPRRGRKDPVFAGGGIVSLLITDPASPPPSWTKDIDLVLEIVGYWEFIGIEEPLQAVGFTRSLGGDDPIMAWQWKNVRVDFLPHLPMPHIDSNRWFPYLVTEAEQVEIMPGKRAWRASAPCFLATKFEAFANRGRGDYVMSKDIEDILAIIDGRPEIVVELTETHHDVQGFIGESCTRLLHTPKFLACLGQLVPDSRRELVVLKRMQMLAGIG